MKKALFIILGLLVYTNVSAQSLWGVKAGGNLSEMITKIRRAKVDGTNVRFGFHVGVLFEYPVIDALTIQPELLFIQNGSSMDGEAGEFARKITTTLYQLQLPINLKYNFKAGNFGWFITAGPYLGYGLSAKRKTEDESISINLYDANNNELKRFDFGIGAGAGIDIKRFIIGLNYQYGLVNLSKLYDITYHMSALQLSVGYLF